MASISTIPIVSLEFIDEDPSTSDRLKDAARVLDYACTHPKATEQEPV